MEDISQRLQEDLADVTWGDLTPHAKRDALIVVHAPLDLVAVGVAIAQDDVNSVQHWISEALIHKPSVEELNAWNVEPTQLFKTLIVQPFVLIQEEAGGRRQE